MTAGTRGRPVEPPRDVLAGTPTTLAAWAQEYLAGTSAATGAGP